MGNKLFILVLLLTIKIVSGIEPEYLKNINWLIVKGMWEVNLQEKVCVQRSIEPIKGSFNGILNYNNIRTSKDFNDIKIIKTDFKFSKSKSKDKEVGTAFGVINDKNFYYIGIITDGDKNMIELIKYYTNDKKLSGNISVNSYKEILLNKQLLKNLELGKWYSLKIMLNSNGLSVFLDEQNVLTYSFERKLSKRSAIYFTTKNSIVSFDNVQIFNYNDKLLFEDKFEKDTIGTKLNKTKKPENIYNAKEIKDK